MFPGPNTPDLEWPTWIVYSAIPLGSSLMCFRFLQVLVNFWRTGDLPKHDHGHVDGLEEEIGQAQVEDNVHPRDMHEPPPGSDGSGPPPGSDGGGSPPGRDGGTRK